MKAPSYAPSREVHEGFGRRTESKNSSLLHCSRYCHCGGDPIHHFSIAKTLTSQISVQIRKDLGPCLNGSVPIRPRASRSTCPELERSSAKQNEAERGQSLPTWPLSDQVPARTTKYRCFDSPCPSELGHAWRDLPAFAPP